MNLDHSSRHVYESCKRKWLLQDYYMLEPKEDRSALVRGGAIHHGIATWTLQKNSIQAAQEAIGELIRRGEVSDMELTQDFKDLIINSVVSYATRYPEEPFKTLDVELSMAAPIGDEGDYYFGVVDALIEHGGIIINKETKTSGMMPSFLEQRYTMESQTLGYIWLALQYGIHTQGVLLDIVRVPNGRNVKYPEYYRSTHFPEDSLLEEWEAEVIADIRFIKQALKEMEEQNIVLSPKFSKNTSACFDYNKRCGFFDFCSKPSLHSDMWRMFQRRDQKRMNRIMDEAKQTKDALIAKYKGGDAK